MTGQLQMLIVAGREEDMLPVGARFGSWKAENPEQLRWTTLATAFGECFCCLIFKF